MKNKSMISGILDEFLLLIRIEKIEMDNIKNDKEEGSGFEERSKDRIFSWVI